MKIIIIVILFFMLLVNVALAETISQEDALNALIKAEKNIEQMEKDNFTTVYVNDLLIEARNSFEGANYTDLLENIFITDPDTKQRAYEILSDAQNELGSEINYPNVIAKSNEIERAKNQAYDIFDALTAIERRLNEFETAGISTARTREKYDIAKTYFEAENYDKAEKNVEEIYVLVGESETEYRLLVARLGLVRNNIINTIQDFWKQILIAIAIFSVMGYYIYKQLYLVYADEKLKALEREKRVIKELMIKAQKDRYIRSKISETEYRAKINKYREKTAEAKEKIDVYRDKLKVKRKKNIKKVKK